MTSASSPISNTWKPMIMKTAAKISDWTIRPPNVTSVKYSYTNRRASTKPAPKIVRPM